MEALKCRRCERRRFDPCVGKIPWRSAWQPTPVLLPGRIPWTEEPGWAKVHGVAKGRTGLKRLSTHACTARGTLLNAPWQPGWEGIWGRMGMCIYVAGSLHCSPETRNVITQLMQRTPGTKQDKATWLTQSVTPAGQPLYGVSGQGARRRGCPGS